MCTTQPIKDSHQLAIFKNYYLHQKPNARNYLLIVIGLNSALRISDILNLTYGDVYDFQRKKWKTHILLTEQKTGKLNCICMNNEIVRALKSSCQPKGKQTDSWLFCSQRQHIQPLSRYQAFRLIKEAAAFAGLNQCVSCHSMRKTFGYYAWKKGIPPVLLMEIYNHSSFQITKRYLGIEQDDKDKVFKSIEI